jgi:tyrosine-specific transport protein
MTTTALIYLECSTWMKKDAHLVSMASKLLGPWGKKVCWGVFVFMCYASLVAYLSGGGRMVEETFPSLLSSGLPSGSAYFIYAIVFGGLLLLGSQIAGAINSFFFGTLLVLFFCMVQGAWDIDTSLLLRHDWSTGGLVPLIPMMLTAFSFPGIVPVLASFHKGDAPSVRSSILGGTALTMIIYAVWLIAVLGNVPWEGDHGLAAAFAADKHACDSLVHYLQKPSLSLFAQGFAFLALTTSFLGIAMGLSHFLSEGFRIKTSTFSGKLSLILMIIIPTLAIKFQFEKIFFHALDISGGIGDGVLSGFIPALMLWRGRYMKGLSGRYRFYGDKLALFTVLSLSTAVVTYEVVKLLMKMI